MIVYTYIDEVMEDMNELLSLVKEYCKEDIIVLGYYLPHYIAMMKKFQIY